MARPTIFISYGREPVVNNFVEQLERDLIENLGFQIWRDVHSILLGDTFHTEIARGISKCNIFIAVITGKFLESKYCPKELFQANDEGKKIIPIIFENVDYAQYENGPGVKLVIRSINHFKFSNGPAEEDYQELLSKLKIVAIKESNGTDIVGNSKGDPRLIQANPQFTPISLGPPVPPGPDVNVVQLRKEVKTVIQSNYYKITDLDDENLEPIAGELSSVDLIGRPTRRSTYKSIVNSILGCNRTMEDTCKKFSKTLKKVEGATSNVSTTTENDWNVAIKKNFSLTLLSVNETPC